MAKVRVETIDGPVLQKELNKRNVTYTAASIACGYEESYVSTAIRTGRMAKTAIKCLQLQFGILPELYVLSEQKKKEDIVVTAVEVPNLDGIFDGENAKKLYAIIYKATYEAMKNALNDN